MHRLVFGAGLLGVAVMLAGCRTCSVPDGLIYYSTLDNVEAIENPVVGPKGRVVGGSFVKGVRDEGYRIEAMKQGAFVDLPANFFGPQGTIEFWAKLLNNKDYFVDGGDPRFFQVDDGKRNAPFFLEYAANDGGGNSGLHVLAADNWVSCFKGFHGSMPYSKVLGNAQNEWHHYAIAWNRDAEGNKLTVYVDGKSTITSEHFYPKGKMEEAYGVPLVLNLGLNEGPDRWWSSKSPYVLDEFKVWEVEKTNFEIKKPAVEAKSAVAVSKKIETRAEPQSAKPNVTIYLRDGSVLKGAMEEESVHLNMVIGPVKVQCDKIQSIRVSE